MKSNPTATEAEELSFTDKILRLIKQELGDAATAALIEITLVDGAPATAVFRCEGFDGVAIARECEETGKLEMLHP